MKSVQKIELAIQLVTTAFSGQKRIAPTDIPASTHSLRVGLSLITYGYPLEVVIAGFCHDLTEDTGVTAEMLEGLFNPRVRFLVDTCSFDPILGERAGEKDLNERVFRLAQEGEVDPLRVKCADCLDNLRTNYHLKREFQISGIESATLRLEAAQKHIPNEILTQDLEMIIARERKRIYAE